MKRAFIEGYKFVYDSYSEKRKGAVGNIIESKGDIVWSGLFEVDDECLKWLDECEGVHYQYIRKQTAVKDDKDNTNKTEVYLRHPKEIAMPSDIYKNIVIEGAQNCGLPMDYIEISIKTWYREPQ
mgnify:FL=1